MRSLAELDGPSVFEQALGRQEAELLMARHREMVASINTRIVKPRPDLGFGMRPSTPSAGVLATITVAAGRRAEFEERLRSTIVPELRDSAAVGLTTGQILFGGQDNQYFALLYFPDFESVSLDGMARLADELDSPVVAMEQTILRYAAAISSGLRQE